MNGTMAMPVNPGTLMAAPMFNPNVKDSRWLTLEVCREYTRNKCTRSDQECKFAHPPPHVEVQNGRVTCCFDSIKGKCQRKDPPCKYLHPPQHLKEQLLQNGRNNLILKNLQIQTMALGGVPPQVIPGIVPTVAPPYMMAQHSFNPYMSNAGMGLIQESAGQANLSSATGSPHQVQTGVILPSTAGMTQKVARADRLESSPVLSISSANSTWNGHPGHVSPSDTVAPCTSASQYNPIYFQPQHVVEVVPTSKKRPRDPAEDLLLGVNPVPGMVPMVKRTATMDGKSGIPMYQPGNNAYQQALAAMQLQQQYVPAVTMSLMPNSHAVATAAAGALVTNATSVNYFDDSNQLLDTLPVCRDFKAGQCKRPQCKYVHLVEDYVEVTEGKVTVCRDAVKGKCSRPLCKYYHIPILPQLLL